MFFRATVLTIKKMGFFMLPEDRVREDAIIRGEHAERTHKRGRQNSGPMAVLTEKLRVAIESRAPRGITARAVLLREFSLLDTDHNGAVDQREFVSVVRRYLNGAEPEDLQQLFRSFDADGNGTISVHEFIDKLLKEAGPHNFRDRSQVYNRNKPLPKPKAPTRAPSTRPRSTGMSQWTAAVKRQAGKPLTTILSNVPSSGRRSSQTSSRASAAPRVDDSRSNASSSLFAPSEAASMTTTTSSQRARGAKDLRWAMRDMDRYHMDGVAPLTKDRLAQHMDLLLLEQMTVEFLRVFRRSVRRSAGKEISGSRSTDRTLGNSGTLTEAVLSGDTRAAKTLQWTMQEFAKASKSSKDSRRISLARFAAAVNVFRGSGPECDERVVKALWAASDKGKISSFVARVFPAAR